MRPIAGLIAREYSVALIYYIRVPLSDIPIHLQSNLFPAVRTLRKFWDIYSLTLLTSIYGHRLKKTRHPVRSAKVKLQIDLLVVGWVTTSESRLLYILYLFALFSFGVGEVCCVKNKLLGR